MDLFVGVKAQKHENYHISFHAGGPNKGIIWGFGKQQNKRKKSLINAIALEN